MKIRTYEQLDDALKKLEVYKEKQLALGTRIEVLQKAVLDFYRRKNRTSYQDASGTEWRKMQGTTTVYNDTTFKKLLKLKGIPITDVYKARKIEERDEQAIFKLLKAKIIKIKEWKKHAQIKYHTAYLRPFKPRKAKGRSGNSSKDS
jgi:hypothetical protein